jgi:hypothetical protein
MERFFSQQNIERYRKLLDLSTDEPQRRLIFKALAAQAHAILKMDTNSSLTVRVERRGDKYIWALHRDGHFYAVRFSAPVYSSEETARAAGNEVRTDHLAHLARFAARRSRAR